MFIEGQQYRRRVLELTSRHSSASTANPLAPTGEKLAITFRGFPTALVIAMPVEHPSFPLPTRQGARSLEVNYASDCAPSAGGVHSSGAEGEAARRG